MYVHECAFVGSLVGVNVKHISNWESQKPLVSHRSHIVNFL